MRSPQPRSMAMVTAIVLILLLAACNSGDSFGPGDRIRASDQELAAINAALLDARDRLVPALHTTDMISPMQVRLSTLSASLLSRRRRETTAALIGARDLMIGSEAAAPPEDGADRAAIMLALVQVRLLLER